MARKKKISIIEVAAEANVSRSTVSRVINNDPRAAVDTVKAVRDAMARLNYTPPPMEKRYRRPSRKPQGIHTGFVTLFFPDVNPDAEHTYLSSQLIRGASIALSKRNLHMLVTHMPEPDCAPDVIVEKKVDGIIVRGGNLPESVLRKVKKIPTVWLFEGENRIFWGDQVAPDNQAVGEIAAEWMIGTGKTNFLTISLEGKHVEFARRQQACVRFLESRGHTCHVINDPAIGHGQLLKEIQRLGPDTAIFMLGQDVNNMGAIMELKQSRYKIGQDLKLIIATNNPGMVRSLESSIANIDLRSEHLAQVAVETLLWRMKNPCEPIRVIYITPRLEG